MTKHPRMIVGLLALTTAALATGLVAAMQVPNEGLANQVVAVRAKVDQMARQYDWNARTEILMNGAMQDIRVELVSYGPDGNLQRSLLNETKGELPGLFLRRAIEENQRKQIEQRLVGLRSLAEQYTLPGAAKIVEFLAGARVQPITSPDGKTMLQINGSNVVVPGDRFTLVLDGATYRTKRVDVSTTYEGDPVTVSATFNALPTGMNFMQYGTVEIPSKKVTVMLHNYDFVQND